MVVAEGAGVVAEGVVADFPEVEAEGEVDSPVAAVDSPAPGRPAVEAFPPEAAWAVVAIPPEAEQAAEATLVEAERERWTVAPECRAAAPACPTGPARWASRAGSRIVRLV